MTAVLLLVFVIYIVCTILSYWYVGLCAFSLPVSFVMIERVYIICLIIIIRSEVWTITHCLGSGRHGTLVCAVCLSIFLLPRTLFKSLGFYQQIQVMCNWNLDLIFRAKLNLEFRNQTIQYGCQAAILKVASPNTGRFLPIHIGNVLLKLGSDIQSLKSGIKYICQEAILKVISLKSIGSFLPIYKGNLLLKLRLDIQSQTKDRPWKPKIQI